MAAFSSRMIEQSDIAVAVAMRTGRPARLPSPKKSQAPKMATTASLRALETTVS